MTRRFAAAFRIAALTVVAASALPARALDYNFSLFGGYQDGLGTRLAASLSDVIPGAPISFSAGVGYAIRDPGDALQARAVFINQNTNGTPQKSGHDWDLRLDVAYHFKVAGLSEVAVFAGVRRSYFNGDFHYVGGNEDFEVTADQWGWGLGVRLGWAVSRDWSITGQFGLDHYPTWSMTGHDATYSSDGSIVNGRNNGNGVAYTIKDADRAINQPWLVPSVLVGITWRPGTHEVPPSGKRR